MISISSTIRKVAAGSTALLATGSLVMVCTLTSPASADIGTSASVATVPLCTWALNGASAAIALTHPSGDGHTAYVGNDFLLSGTEAAPAHVFVGPSSATSASTTDSDNCSFYTGSSVNVANSGATVSMAIPSGEAKFTASDSKGDDPAMGFALDGSATPGAHSNSITISLTPSSCVDNSVSLSGADWATASGTTKLNGTSSPVAVATIAKANTTTSSSCSFTTGLSVYIPGGKTPRDPSQTYAFTGPSLTTTLTTPGT